jgi:hypothetical protein
MRPFTTGPTSAAAPSSRTFVEDTSERGLRGSDGAEINDNYEPLMVLRFRTADARSRSNST